MTRSSTKELITPFKNPESAFRSKRRLYETPGLVESSSPELDLFSNKETTGIMMETMDQYMSKTRRNYGSGVVRPKINDKTHFELKVQYLKELRKNTFSRSEHEDTNEHIKKVLEIVDLFHILEEVILFYNGLDVPTKQILDSKGRSTETSNGLAAIQAHLNNLRREIKKFNEKVYAAQDSTEQQGQDSTNATTEFFVLQEKGIGGLPDSTEPNPRDHVKSISTTKADSSEIRRLIIIDDEDVTGEVALGMPFFMKYVSCQRIMKKFAHENKCERMIDE
ncbi:hypothetical protein Tco_0260624 [Tanacetum coccineum]